jgi:threonine dehydrogenase-like Zn-dependent dehydrogenase
MRGAVLHAPGDVRVEDRDRPTMVAPTDAIIRLSATCVCGSDLWPYRGIEKIEGPTPMGHEDVGIVEEVGDQESMMQAIRATRPGGPPPAFLRMVGYALLRRPTPTTAMPECHAPA